MSGAINKARRGLRPTTSQHRVGTGTDNKAKIITVTQNSTVPRLDLTTGPDNSMSSPTGTGSGGGARRKAVTTGPQNEGKSRNRASVSETI